MWIVGLEAKLILMYLMLLRYKYILLLNIKITLVLQWQINSLAHAFQDDYLFELKIEAELIGWWCTFPLSIYSF